MSTTNSVPPGVAPAPMRHENPSVTNIPRDFLPPRHGPIGEMPVGPGNGVMVPQQFAMNPQQMQMMPMHPQMQMMQPFGMQSPQIHQVNVQQQMIALQGEVNKYRNPQNADDAKALSAAKLQLKNFTLAHMAASHGGVIPQGATPMAGASMENSHKTVHLRGAAGALMGGGYTVEKRTARYFNADFDPKNPWG